MATPQRGSLSPPGAHDRGMTDVVVRSPSCWICCAAHATFSAPRNPLHDACVQGSLPATQAPFPGNTLTGPHIHEFGCQNPPLRILGKEPILSQQPLHSPPTAHLPALLRTPPHWAWETKGHSHSPPPYPALLGIQPPSPGALGPQLSRAAPPPISPPAFWEFPAAHMHTGCCL